MGTGALPGWFCVQGFCLNCAAKAPVLSVSAIHAVARLYHRIVGFGDFFLAAFHHPA